MPVIPKAVANYMNSQLIKMEANVDDYMEGIGLDTVGYVSEVGCENIFIAKNGKLYTHSTGSSILPGITRHGTQKFFLCGNWAIP